MVTGAAEKQPTDEVIGKSPDIALIIGIIAGVLLLLLLIIILLILL